jgi:O-acetyl-ADP-ribose deacetylase (regulator of RNase III)
MTSSNLHFKQGDFLAPETGLFVHGCNMLGVMGSGAALAVRKKYPKCYKEYKNALYGGVDGVLGGFCPGDVFYYQHENNNIVIANAFTQIEPGCNAKISYIRQALVYCFEFALRHKLPMHTVQIGCGIGGLSWENDVLQIFQGFAIMFPNVDCTVWSL